jgi:HEAT repeat protein
VKLPHAEIRESADRSYTGLLVERLAQPDLPEEERDEVVCSLLQLVDPRAEPLLLRLLEDRAAPVEVRKAASWVLRGNGFDHDRRWLHAAWQDGDAVLRRHALLCMDRADADIVTAVASDPEHPLHGDAILAMEFGFQEPRFQALKIAALDHPDPRVREIACDTLLWDEPLAAEAPLLRRIHDEVPAVAISALKTLAYYPSQHCLRQVAELRAHENAAIRETAERVFDDLRDSFLWSASRHTDEAARGYMRAWIRPVWDLLAPTEEDLAPPSAGGPAPAPAPGERISAAVVMAQLGDPSGPWAERRGLLYKLDADAFSMADRAALMPFLCTHPDADVRGNAARLLACWGEADALLNMLHDPRFNVRKSAMYHLGTLPPDPAIARRAWAHLGEASTTSTHAYETLVTYVAHAPREEAIPRLVTLAREDERESVRYQAVHSLRKAGAREALGGLMSLLEEPPQVTWGVHIALLESATELGLSAPGIGTLRQVDDAYVQEAIARYLARGG